jgi:hypothetical protein
MALAELAALEAQLQRLEAQQQHMTAAVQGATGEVRLLQQVLQDTSAVSPSPSPDECRHPQEEQQLLLSRVRSLKVLLWRRGLEWAAEEKPDVTRGRPHSPQPPSCNDCVDTSHTTDSSDRRAHTVQGAAAALSGCALVNDDADSAAAARRRQRRFLARLPERVVRDGAVVDVRASIANLLAGK